MTRETYIDLCIYAAFCGPLMATCINLVLSLYASHSSCSMNPSFWRSYGLRPTYHLPIYGYERGQSHPIHFITYPFSYPMKTVQYLETSSHILFAEKQEKRRSSPPTFVAWPRALNEPDGDMGSPSDTFSPNLILPFQEDSSTF